MANCLRQPRSARQMVRSNRLKVGVGCHSHGHFPEQLKTFLPTNVGLADAMGRVLLRKEKAFAVNSRAGRNQLLWWTLDQKKTRPVTGKRMRRRQDMRSAPVGPAGGMRNVSTEQDVSSRGQPVRLVRQCPWAILQCMYMCCDMCCALRIVGVGLFCLLSVTYLS